MVCLPLIGRELRVAFRKQRPAQTRLKVAATVAGGSMVFVLMGAMSGSGDVGRNLELLLCSAGLYCVLRVPVLTAGVLAEERQNQTLGLLFLSGLGAWEVFAGKFISSALLIFTNLLAIFPMLALPFLLGGVSFDVFLATICELPALMLFALAVTMLASVLTREEGVAVVLSFVAGTLVCVLTPTIYYAQEHFSPGSSPSLWWWRLSPAYGPHLLWHGLGSRFPANQRAEFWLSFGLTLAWTVFVLVAAAFALTRLWRDPLVEQGNLGVRERWRDFLHGSRASRARLAQSWLDQNPFVWLAARDQQPAKLGWMIVGGLCLVWLVCWAAWPSYWPSVQNFFITATLLNTVLAWLSRHMVARQIAQPRCDGAYELLLTTPLYPGDIVWGTLEAVRLHLRPLMKFILALNTAMMLGGLFTRPWTAAPLIVYWLMWLVLLYWTWSIGQWQSSLLLVMWVSLNCARPAHAVWRSSGLNTWSWIWILFNLQFLGRHFRAFPTGSTGEVLVISFVALVVSISWLSRLGGSAAASVQELRWDHRRSFWISSRSLRNLVSAQYVTRLINEFREIVREPLPDPADPRFKKWNVHERFPWGWQMIQQQLHERLARR